MTPLLGGAVQSVVAGPSMGYPLATALEPEVRARPKRDLLTGYLDRRDRSGHATSSDYAWLRYRQQLMGACRCS
jgi:hypothetical protein